MKTFKKFCFWPVFFSCQLLALALLSWHLLAQVHFAYPAGYQLLKLDAHIAEFAPLNRYKDDFEFTSAQEHWRLFGEISDAVQNRGEGLADIRYSLKNGEPAALMHKAEIVHLQDVANLIDGFYRLGAAALVLWLVLIALARQQQLRLPALKKVLAGFGAGLATIGLLVWIAEPKNLFYWLHEQVFPAGHQWFFYYQDSLMTTLMKAPDIFAFIALLLVALFMVFWGASVWGINRLLK